MSRDATSCDKVTVPGLLLLLATQFEKIYPTADKQELKLLFSWSFGHYYNSFTLIFFSLESAL